MERIELCSIRDMFLLCSIIKGVSDEGEKLIIDGIGDLYFDNGKLLEESGVYSKELCPDTFLHRFWDFPILDLGKSGLAGKSIATVNELWFVLGHYMHSGEADGTCSLVKQESGWVFELMPGSGREWWECFNPTGEFIGSHWKKPLCLSRYRTYCKELTNGN